MHYEGNIIRPPSEANSILLQVTVSLKRKTLDELKELKDHGLGIIYMGIETGDDVTLKKINKGATAGDMIQMGRKAREAGIRLSITVLLGIAGKTRSKIHAQETGRVLSEIDPEYIGALSLMLIPGTPLYQDYVSGEFTLLESVEMLEELINRYSAGRGNSFKTRIYASPLTEDLHA